jgi:ABC-type histidine transport system ATPase subunit
MVDVFEEQVIKITEQKLKQTLEKLKKDAPLQRKFRELVVLSSTLEKVKVILKDSSMSKDNRDKWVAKRDKQIEKRDNIYSEIEFEGFEHWWMMTIVYNEMKNFKKVINDAREEAYKKHFGKVGIEDIDIKDNRLELVGQQMEQAKVNYVKGK